jgi:4-azaleucine resistance transporter AzlC
MTAQRKDRDDGGFLGRIAAVAAVNAVVGVTVAASAVDLGLSEMMATVLTAGMFSGAAQFAAMTAQSDGSSLVVALVAAMLINARFILLGASAAGMVGGTRVRRLAIAPLLVDPIVVIAQRAPEARSARRWLIVGGSVTIASWSIGAVIGAFGASRIADPATWGLDIALPALLLAILASSARSDDQRSAALVGAGLAVFLLLAGVAGGLVVLLGALGCVGPMLSRTMRNALRGVAHDGTKRVT